MSSLFADLTGWEIAQLLPAQIVTHHHSLVYTLKAS
ncbi:hypothetical protein FHR34_005217 [Kitasatospora kifunensis]|uniref:Uncharacterized protein n=1 Tax=Kitasatospora kifunensis TaxID=58351 RepID=A0A7W7R6N5_KITKI|nr:hypothetical protein [Kitasatospora kifunensis]